MSAPRAGAERFAVHWFDPRLGWVAQTGLMSRAFAEGYLTRHAEQPGPRLKARIFDTVSGLVVREVDDKPDVSLGAGVGFPTPADHVRAAARALARAVKLAQPYPVLDVGDDREALRRALAEAQAQLDALSGLALPAGAP